MESVIYKQGILKKEGKKKLQGKRKRWFDLNGQQIKYYDPDTKNSKDGLLGTIDISEITTVVYSKSTKYGFDIKTNSRTYYLEAKTDADREDWMNVIQKACSQQRGNSDQIASGKPPIVQETKTKSKEKKKKSRSSFFSDSIDDVNNSPLPSQPSLSLVEEKSESEVSKESDIVNNDVVNKQTDKKVDDQSLSVIHQEFYTNLNKELDDVISDEEDGDTFDNTMTSNITSDVINIEQFEALSKLKNILQNSNYEKKSIDVEFLASRFDVPSNSDYIYMALLKAITNTPSK